MNTQSLIQDALGKFQQKAKPYYFKEGMPEVSAVRISDIESLLPEIIERVVLGLVPDEIRMAEVDFKGEVPVDVLSDVMEFTTDPTFHKGWNQCREKILASLKENKV